MTEQHPVTLGDLRVVTEPPSCVCGGIHHSRPATVADLVSALRAEGVLVIEKVDGQPEWKHAWPDWAWNVLHHDVAALAENPAEEILDALAEAQPFPPAGG